MSSSLVDLAPIAQVMLGGLVLAALALAFVALRTRHDPRRNWLRAATVLTLFLTFDLVLFGAFTRLTDSGLGCPDWPGCYGSATPLGAKAEIGAAQAAMPSGPVTHGKAWIEMVHRYMATGVGALIVVLTVLGWRQHLRRIPGGPVAGSPWWPTATLVWVCVQGAFGALTVTMKLFPAIVTMHLLGALLLLAMLAVQVEQQGRLVTGAKRIEIDPTSRTLLVLAMVLLVLQSALGGWVSTNYAVLACTDFPTCQGSWWPEMHFSQGFEIWRELGMTGAGDHVSFAALTAIHYVHRLTAYVVLATLGVLAWRLWRFEAARVFARAITVLAALQLATGLGNVVLGWPLAAALLHTGGASALVVVLTWCISGSRSGQLVGRPAKFSALGSIR
jgi:cytochrome c oxidase assembly protein subunit 15